MEGSKEEVDSYSVTALLEETERDVLMDYRGQVNKSFECAPEHAYRVVNNLEKNYQGGFPDPWFVDYSVERSEMYVCAEKSYDRVREFADGLPLTVDPSRKVFINPRKEEGVHVEISGLMDFSP